MSELQTVQTQPQTTQSKRLPLAVVTGASALVLTNVANAAIDVAPVTSELSDLITPIGLVGAAYLLVIVAIKGWKIIRRAL
ncbi:major capsid protein [Acinetobacter pittii]|uniref:major capsid protein n=1 Tax=Acinetobacter TaxID=469 RepID=UPI001E2BABDB|nr:MULTISPECIES: major capsid protein [Acinetobacter]MCH2013730.1 major capsid protein [Acinetobacter pittii]MDA3448864.1 major capsid protein [Acinetobacter sp. AOR40_HL]MDA3456146.1 major capsid protein [Acinetobacter sp. AOR39_HL]MDP7845483.1 major capsid protein [Acinetobacter pittii]MDP7872927.1 major capsid protein [Acinetobacter pittii]